MVDFDSRLHYEWLKKRQSGISGSDVAAILGISKWRTPLHVYLDKTQQIVPDREETMQQWMGKRLEGAILDMYAHRLGDSVELARGGDDLHRHPGVHHFIGTLDAMAAPHLPPLFEVADWDRRYVVDAKRIDPAVAHEWGRDGSGNAPEEYAAQLLWYMGLDSAFWKGDLSVLIGTRDFRIITIERADDLIEAFQREADRFWHKHVMRLVPPPVDTVHRTASDVVKTVFGKVAAKHAELAPTAYLAQLLREYFTGQAMESVGKRLRSRATAALVELQGGLGSTVVTGTDLSLESKIVRKEAYSVAAQEYVNFRVAAPRGVTRPMFEEAERLLQSLVANDVDRRLIAGAVEEESGHE